MAIYPGASVRLIDTKFLSGGKLISPPNRTNVHTQGGSGSLYGYYSATNRPSSHGWVSYTGLVEQYVDTANKAEADLDGNDATISWEVEGYDEPYTQAQIDALIPLLSWTLDAHGIWRQIAWSSQTNESSKGLSWHRLGIDGNFPALPSRYAGRKQRGGGMHYSSSFGKVCPGNARIDQLFDIVFPAVLGVPTTPVIPVNNPIPVPVPPPVNTGIDVDGYWGSGTTHRAQDVLGTVSDGEIWYQYAPNAQPAFTSGWVYNYSKGNGSPLIAAMQRGMGISDDGVVGQQFIRAFQSRMGTAVDGELWAESPAVKEFQRRLNAGTW